jgi:5'-methylthioadenosine phosphorylase
MKIGIIGGTGLDDPQLLKDYNKKEVDTEYGKPSSPLTLGKINGVDVCILARHGKGHTIPPSKVNFKANIKALDNEGVDYIFATTAVGSLREEIFPGDLVFPNQVIDFTKQRDMTFYDKPGKVIHTPSAEPFDKKLRNIFSKTSKELLFNYHENKTIISIEGPRFSTKAESHMFREWGADIINMSTCPEVFLANELGIPYQAIAMSTDYDCWKEDEEHVTWEMIKLRMNENVEKVKTLIVKSIESLVEEREYIKSTIRTVPNWPKEPVQFRDITTLLQNPKAKLLTLDILTHKYQNKGIDVVVGIESRGFILGSELATRLNASFVPARKKGKLPHETISETYELEYGTDEIEIHKDSIKPEQKVHIHDDLIATGGTAAATCNLVEKLGGVIEGISFVIDLPDKKGKEKLSKHKVFTLVEFEGK